MTDPIYAAQQHGQYITNKSFAEQIAKLESRIASLESALAQSKQEPVMHQFKYENYGLCTICHQIIGENHNCQGKPT